MQYSLFAIVLFYSGINMSSFRKLQLYQLPKCAIKSLFIYFIEVAGTATGSIGTLIRTSFRAAPMGTADQEAGESSQP